MSSSGFSMSIVAQEMLRSANEIALSKGDRPDVEKMQTMIEQQNLVIQTLLAVLLQKGLVTKEEFREMLDRVDMLDGKKDGKLSERKEKRDCPKCKAKVSADKPKCEFCGASLS